MEEKTLTISGVKIVFPCKPYPSQFGMMDRVIKGLERKQNCLLESPTGSGKSLALLCSALAWQVAQYEKLARENIASTAGCCKPCTCGAADAKNTSLEQSVSSKCEDKEEAAILIDDGPDDFEDDDFKPSSKIRTPNITKNASKKRKHLGVKYDDEDDDGCTKLPVKCTCSDAMQNDSKKKEKEKILNYIRKGVGPNFGPNMVSKIYFGTRTHKQIAQIIRELKKTRYHDSRMVILGSREYTCVHPEVVKMKNKSEGCRERLDIHGPGCRFNDQAKRVFLSQRILQDELPSAWDLEDLVSSCKKKKACPYFVTRNIKEGADIVFCPYNYLIDPLVRKSMDISLKDQVVILDEAHNIEDCARDAASGSITTEQLNQSIHNLEQLLECNIKFADHLKLRNMLQNLLQFIEGNNSSLNQSDYETSYKVWSGFDIVVRLKSIGLGPDNVKEYQRCLDEVTAQGEDEQMSVRDRRNQTVKLNSSTQTILEQLFQILDYMYRTDLKFVEDYRVAITKTMQFVSNRDMGDQWLGKNRRGGSRIVVYTLNFWCMNPAVAFSDFSSCRNVVLSSGTLSPMSSFASELGSPFPIQLEANHIIEDKQVWVGAVGTGPSGSQLQAVYKNMETFAFQDELGNLIHQVCSKVPHGVLCFLPSYRALEKFTDRWKLTGLWGNLTRRKRVMVEPRAVDREQFDGMMKAFYKVVKGDVNNGHLDDDDYCEDDDKSEVDGALFFAVCRGKVSEGMDFADNNARAVITVGIPFPSIKDLQVKLKREYNDKHRNDRGLLSGSDWYEIQAFRALNQALGRCIRHRKDWGALIIVDDRFVKKADRYCKSLSRWVRSKVKTFETFSNFLGSMSKFTDTMIKEMPIIDADTSFIPSTPVPGRRDSVYSYQSPDLSHLNTSNNSSPQFRSPPLSQSIDLTKTPSSVSAKKTAGPGIITSPSLPQYMTISAGVSSLSVQEQLMSVINSGKAPTNQPYFAVVNQGTPNQQTFLIQPNTSQQPVGNPTPNQAPLIPAANAGGNPVSQPLVLINQQPTTVDPPLAGGTSLLTASNLDIKPNVQGTGCTLNVIGQTDCKNTEGQGVTGKGEATKDTKASDIVFNINSDTMGVEEQLKNFIMSNAAPKTQPYYVVVNKGYKNEKAFFIEPNKKGKSKSTPDQGTGENTSVQKTNEELKVQVPATTGTVTQESGTQTSVKLKPVGIGSIKLESVQQEPVKQEVAKMEPVEQETVKLGQDNPTGGEPNSENGFLKFCHLPKMPASKVPVATVTPQRIGNTGQGTGISNTKHQDSKDVVNAVSVAGTSDLDKYVNQRQTHSISPVLFEEQTVLTTLFEPVVDKANDTDDLQSESKTKRKSLFKKRTSMDNKNNQESEGKDGDKALKQRDIVKAEENDNEGDDFKPVRSEKDTRCNTIADKFAAMLDKVKPGRNVRRSTGTVQRETKPDTNAELAAQDSGGESDDEFLNTRRRGGRKRKATSKYAEWSKKSKKGVVYEDDDSGKENNADKGSISCIYCGKAWTMAANCERQKRQPEFLKGVFKKNTELLYLPYLKTEDSPSLSVVTQTEAKGVKLNSIYDDTAGCCVQLLQCKQCNSGSVIGAMVQLVHSTSKYTAGQTWILSSEAKLHNCQI